MAKELAHQTWTRITGRPWSEAKKAGLTDGSAAANLALQKKLLSGVNVFEQAVSAPNPETASTPPATVTAPDPYEAYRKAVTDWYSVKPSTPSGFQYSAEQEAADKRSVGDQYRPFFQEKVSQANEQFTRTMQNAREGFSRRGLWGAAGVATSTVDPSTGLTMQSSRPATTSELGGPVSGLRQVGERDITQQNDRSNTAFQRSYVQSVAEGTQGRQAEAQDVYQKTIRDPYEEQYRQWMQMLPQQISK